jgi:hypothetical protein
MTILFESKSKRENVFFSPLVLYYAMGLPCFTNELTFSVWYISNDYKEKMFEQMVVSENEVKFFQHLLEDDCDDLAELKLYSKTNNKELDGFVSKLGIHDITTEKKFTRYFGEIDSNMWPHIQKTQNLGFSPFLPKKVKYSVIHK